MRRKVEAVSIESREASPRQAAETLGEIAELRLRARRSLGAPWFPLVCFGALTMLSAPLVAVAGVAVLAPFWVVAGASGMLLIRRHYRHRTQRRGVTGRGRRAWSIAAAICVGGFAAGIFGGAVAGDAAGVLGPITVVLVGYASLGWLQRSIAPPLAVAPGATLAGALVLTGAPPWAVELTFGAALVAAGAGLRARSGP